MQRDKGRSGEYCTRLFRCQLYGAEWQAWTVYAVDIGMRGEAYPDATFGMGHMINRKVQAGTGNLAKEPAMSMEICDRAIEAGKELVRECKEKGYEILAVGEMGIGNTNSDLCPACGHCLICQRIR